MYVVTFNDFVPEPRYDGVSWRFARIDEGAAPEGPWTLIDTKDVGVDTDPTHPAARNFTTANATLAEAWYRITFVDANGNDQLPVAPLHRSASGESSFLPSVQQVASHITSRTRDKYGNLVGTFNKDTQPTDTQVLNLIPDAATDVADVIGDDVPPELWDDASNVIAERTAMMIETSFYSEQVNSARSPYPQLKEQYEADLAALSGDTSGEGPPSGPGRKVSYNFPDSPNWMGRVM